MNTYVIGGHPTEAPPRGSTLRKEIVDPAGPVTIVAMRVRRLGPGEHELLRTVRLRALADAPSAYGSTYEREHAFTVEIWDGRLRAEANTLLMCEADDGTPIGMAGGVRDADDPHMGDLVSMWVDPVARGSGAADALVAEVIRWAERAPLRILKLHITEGNVAAERLYERHGFTPTGTTFVRERDGMTETEMARPTA
jgi:GNAT superfamily N-acetyltransferase